MKYLLIFISIVTIACSPEELLIHVKPQESRLVIGSQFVPDSFLIVTISKSFSALAPDNFESLEEDFVGTLLVENALVVVHSGSDNDTLENIVPGIFIGQISNPVVGEFFELSVFDSTTALTISAETYLTSRVPYENVSVEERVEGQDTSYFLHYEFTDPDGPNWYIAQANTFRGLSLDEVLDIDIVDDSLHVEIDTTQTVFDRDFENEILFTKLHADITFESDVVKREIQLFEDPGDTVIFVLINVDEGYYRFLDARQRTGGIIASATGEPINHPSNVENGFGYYAMNIPYFGVFIKED